MSDLNVINDSLLSLIHGLHPSRVEFKLPEKGFEQLSTLIGRISGVLEETGDEQFVQVKNALNELISFLIYDQDLGLYTSVYRQFTEIGQETLLEEACEFWDKLIQFLQNITEPDQNDTLPRLHDLIGDHNDKLLDCTREYLLGSAAAYDKRVLERVASCQGARTLGLAAAAELRNRNMSLRPDLFGSGAPPPAVPNPSHQPEQPEREDGENGEDEEDDDFLFFPGELNGVRVKPIIDTGGTLNLVKKSWLEEHGFKVVSVPERQQKILNADGTISTSMPYDNFTWKFDSQDKTFEDVEFVVMTDFSHDALVGLPFLKKSRMLHNRKGSLVFPEYEGVRPKRREASPIYNQSGVIKTPGS